MNYIFGLLAGISIIISLVQSGKLADYVGTFQGTVLNFTSGLLGVFIIFILTGESPTVLSKFNKIPWIGYIGGFIGVVIIILGTIVIQKISVIASTMLIYIGQLTMGIVIDMIRKTELSIGKIIGCILIICGVLYNTSLDAKVESSYKTKK